MFNPHRDYTVCPICSPHDSASTWTCCRSSSAASCTSSSHWAPFSCSWPSTNSCVQLNTVKCTIRTGSRMTSRWTLNGRWVNMCRRSAAVWPPRSWRCTITVWSCRRSTTTSSVWRTKSRRTTYKFLIIFF